REKRRAMLHIKKLEANRWKDINSLKSSFFANIYHELRTPLTLIMSPLQKLMEDQSLKKYNSTLKMMYWNTNRLLFMINQILDLSKLDAGKLQLQVSEINIKELFEPILFSFKTLTDGSTKTFDYEINDPDTLLYCDVEKIERVISNLLSNSFKYTCDNGMISYRCRKVNYIPENMNLKKAEEYLEIVVFDNGKGIPTEIQDKIFERFFTYHHTFESSTGIGLSLTKELVNMHGGNIKVESTPGLLTAFYVYLPIGLQHLTNYEEIPLHSLRRNTNLFLSEQLQILSNHELDTERPEKMVILLVEDNKELQQLLKEMLSPGYKVLVANNGKNGLALARKEIPDLVISDIMMPKVNGFDLCKNLKSDLRTSHIPVILLSDKAANEDELARLAIGANDYITKPFQNSEVLLKVRNILEYRNRLKVQYRNYIYGKTDKISSLSKEDRFLISLREVLEKNYKKNDFNVDAFAETLKISRVQLHRKVKSLTNQSTSDFMRNYRLEKAKELINNKNLTISQISFEVGFSNPSYFTESFKKHFGTVPSHYAEK
ncbi:MAG: response regulator, partial [Cyclobacteriaceae bacterium]